MAFTVNIVQMSDSDSEEVRRRKIDSDFDEIVKSLYALNAKNESDHLSMLNAIRRLRKDFEDYVESNDEMIQRIIGQIDELWSAIAALSSSE